jgi:hypothetical protein
MSEARDAESAGERTFTVSATSLNHYLYRVTGVGSEAEAQQRLDGYVGFEEAADLPEGVEFIDTGPSHGVIETVEVWD